MRGQSPQESTRQIQHSFQGSRAYPSPYLHPQPPHFKARIHQPKRKFQIFLRTTVSITAPSLLPPPPTNPPCENKWGVETLSHYGSTPLVTFVPTTGDPKMPLKSLTQCPLPDPSSTPTRKRVQRRQTNLEVATMFSIRNRPCPVHVHGEM